MSGILRGRYQTIGIQGEITGKARADRHELSQRKYYATDTQYQGQVYPFGGDENNLKIMPGELLMSWMGRRNRGPRELGFTAFNGMIRGFANKEVLRRNLTLLGPVKTEDESRGTDSFPLNMQQMDFGFIRAGTFSVVNLWDQDIYAGDLLEWDIPEFESYNNITQYNTARAGHAQNAVGTPAEKLQAFFKRADYTDFADNVELAHALARSDTRTGLSPGILGLTVKDLLNDGALNRPHALTPTQEEALGLKIGVLTIMAMGIEMFRGMPNINTAAEFFNAAMEDQNADVFSEFKNSEKTNNSDYDIARANVVRIMLGAVNQARHAKTSRVRAKALNHAAPGDTLNIMMSHTGL